MRLLKTAKNLFFEAKSPILSIPFLKTLRRGFRFENNDSIAKGEISGTFSFKKSRFQNLTSYQSPILPRTDCNATDSWGKSSRRETRNSENGDS